MRTLVIDNYDSFTYNLVHMVENLSGQAIQVRRNDELTVAEAGEFDQIILSPGPGLPSAAGITNEVIKTWYQSKKILGVCLGHQAIAHAFGGKLVNLDKVCHGISSIINTNAADPLFNGLPTDIEVGRYHSWVVENPLPEGFVATAFDQSGHVMSMMHINYNIHSVQFHPESVLTPQGEKILENWLNKC